MMPLMDVPHPPRVGVPSAGQFATNWRVEAAVALGEQYDDSMERFDEDYYWPDPNPEFEHPADSLVQTITELCTYEDDYIRADGRTDWDGLLGRKKALVACFAYETHMDPEVIRVFASTPGLAARDWMAIAQEGLAAHAEDREPNLRRYLLRAALRKTDFADWNDDPTGSPLRLREQLGEHLDGHFAQLTDENYHWTTEPNLDPAALADRIYPRSYAEILAFWADVPTEVAYASLYAKIPPAQVAAYRKQGGVAALQTMIALRA